MEVYLDWVWYCWSVAQDAWRYVIVMIAVHFAWTFTRRVRRRVKAQEKLRAGQESKLAMMEMNNNNNYYVNNKYPRHVMMCHKSTQWEEEPQPQTQTSVTNKSSFSSLLADKDKARNREPLEGQRVQLRRGGNAEEGLTALKIKQLMTNSSTSTTTNGTRSSDKRIKAQLGSIKQALNGHVNDLKMRFEDHHADVKELRHFQKAVDSVTVMKRFTDRISSEEMQINGKEDKSNSVKDHEDHVEEEVEEDLEEEKITSEDESTDNDTTVILRRKRNESLSNGLQKYKLLNEFGGSVHSLEDILNQQRFSRSLSQYSVSDLCWDESPAQINRDCERFDELFCRSTEDLRNQQQKQARNGGASDTTSPLSKFGSMVDVVNV